MTGTSLRRVLLLSATPFLMAFGCYPSGAPPQPGIHLNVPFHWQNSELYCGEANVQMWDHYIWGSAASQETILTYMQNNYPWEVGRDGSLSPHGIALAANWFVMGGISEAYYDEYQKRQAIADQKMGINRGNPTIVLTEGGFHSVTLKGAAWHELSTLQPSSDYMFFHDPRDGSSIAAAVSYWMDVKGTGCFGYSCIVNIQSSGQYRSSVSELAEYDYWGGTYYGDPAPPDGCTECEVMASRERAPIRRFMSVLGSFFSRPAPVRASRGAFLSPGGGPAGSVAQLPPKKVRPERGRGVRREIYVPHPWTSSEQQVIENFNAGMRQTRMYQIAGWQDLEPDSRRTRVSRVEPVTSLSGHPDYYLLQLTSTATNEPYGLATVSREGWLLSVTVFSETSFRSAWSDPSVARHVTDRLHVTPRRLQRVYAEGNSSQIASELHPFWQADTTMGEVLVDEQGEMFMADPSGEHLLAGKAGLRSFRRLAR